MHFDNFPQFHSRLDTTVTSIIGPIFWSHQRIYLNTGATHACFQKTKTEPPHE